jgi:hypothetical protein
MLTAKEMAAGRASTMLTLVQRAKLGIVRAHAYNSHFFLYVDR